MNKIKLGGEVLFTWSVIDQVWVARALELDGVVTHGETLVEAAKMIDEAITLYLESIEAERGSNGTE